ncbi:protein-L-isoaspartate O-methyltransferase [Streptomyces sp. YIM 98790]|uniref:protein-L-isoaspartate O-methyltransferase n=1 Tax=Streptomyces sp. YIM 98790 TaxID=2689077 RepID=UPI0028BF2FC9|nr:protein-L-isoaspartate O-methyltransferase [Streptomyces sp. YIM 98790]
MFGERRRRLADAMEWRGDWPLEAPWIRHAVGALPRHRFAPDRVYHCVGRLYVPVDRWTQPDRWADVVYSGPDDPTVVQVADGRPVLTLASPAAVVAMLAALAPEPGEHLLELGTGCGWNAALLSWRTGPGNVVSVEPDPRLADQARRRLDGISAEVAVETGDREAGWPDSAPYDGVIATSPAERIPWAWVAQTRPGGRIVVPWGLHGHLVLLVAEDGRSASGHVRPRPQTSTPCDDHLRRHPAGGVEETQGLDGADGIGITVTADKQTVWLRDEDNVLDVSTSRGDRP